MPRSYMIALALAGAVAVLALAITTIHRLGRESVEAEINQKNQEAGYAADQASSVFERCIDGGGLFDFATGECRGR